MVGKKDPDVERCLQMALKGVDVEAAWKRCGCPGTLANVKRHFKAVAPSTSAGGRSAEPSAPPSAKRRRTTPAETPHPRQQTTSAASASAAMGKRKEPPPSGVPSDRTGAPLAKKIRKTTAQLETEARNKATFWQQYKAAHKAATLEYAAYVAKAVHRRKGCTASDVAAKYNSTLAPVVPAGADWQGRRQEGQQQEGRWQKGAACCCRQRALCRRHQCASWSSRRRQRATRCRCHEFRGSRAAIGPAAADGSYRTGCSSTHAGCGQWQGKSAPLRYTYVANMP